MHVSAWKYCFCCASVEGDSWKRGLCSIVSAFLTYFYDVSVSEQNLTDLYIILTVILGFPSLPHNRWGSLLNPVSQPYSSTVLFTLQTCIQEHFFLFQFFFLPFACNFYFEWVWSEEAPVMFLFSHIFFLANDNLHKCLLDWAVAFQ